MTVGTAERLYYDSPVLEFTATVTDVRLLATEQHDGERVQMWQIALDRTAFYPEGGGQPWDTGELVATARSGATLQVRVERVLEDEAGEVWHVVRKPLIEGTAVHGRVDAARRLDHAQQHTGQHLLSAVFLREIGAQTVSFHLGDEVSSIDLRLAEGGVALGGAELVKVEEATNQLVLEDRRIVPQWMDRAEAEAMLARGDLHKLPERIGPMRLVEIEGVEFNACGGTHLSSTGRLGCVLLRGQERVKGGVRVEFVCGLRAVRASRQEYEQLNAVAGLLSTAAAETPDRVRRLLEENKAAGRQMKELEEQLAGWRAEDLVRKAVGPCVAEILDATEAEQARRIASRIAAAGLCAVLGSKDAKGCAVAVAVPAGSERKAGSLLKLAMDELGGRGGGGPTLAQAVCSPDQVPVLVARLRELVK